MEKLNDTVKSIHSKKSNKFGACSDVVKVTYRQNQLAGQKRTSHCYTKSDSEYCEKTIFEKRHRVESPAQRVPSALLLVAVHHWMLSPCQVLGLRRSYQSLV